MATLANHPLLRLNDEAAAALDLAESEHTVFDVLEAGRSAAKQQTIQDRWLLGGNANRPPHFFKPWLGPADSAPHVVGGGLAVTIRNWAEFLEIAEDYDYFQVDPENDPRVFMYNHPDFVGDADGPIETPKSKFDEMVDPEN